MISIFKQRTCLLNKADITLLKNLVFKFPEAVRTLETKQHLSPKFLEIIEKEISLNFSNLY